MRHFKDINFNWVHLAIVILLLTGSTLSQAQNDSVEAVAGADPVHGCTLETAIDRTGESSINLKWSNPHSKCLIVSPGTTVQWNGNFTSHPLSGGISGNKDFISPISIASDFGGVTSVTFNEPDDYPYFCEIHTSIMNGVIYVSDAPPDPLIFKDGFERQ